jgi:hypothetical protein
VTSHNCGTCGEQIRPDPMTGTSCACARRSVENVMTDEDAANVGRALVEAIRSCRPGYSWNNCPSEIVADLINEAHDLQVAAEKKLTAERTSHREEIKQMQREFREELRDAVAEARSDERGNGHGF